MTERWMELTKSASFARTIPKLGSFLPPMLGSAVSRYVNPSDVALYFRMAKDDTFVDRMFQTDQGPSFPTHLFIMADTPAPTATSDSFASPNPGGLGNASSTTAGTAPAGEVITLILPGGRESSVQYVGFEHPSLEALSDKQGVSWRYYTPSAGFSQTRANSICRLRFRPDRSRNVVLQLPIFFQGDTPRQLAAAIIRTGQAFNHSERSNGSGPSWVASLANAMGNSVYCHNIVIFIITWDKRGSWYDYVAPKTHHSYEYGFRVPLMAVSPHAKPSYVSDVTDDFGRMLRFVEQLLTLPSPGDSDARADNINECFGCNQTPADVSYHFGAGGRTSHFLGTIVYPSILMVEQSDRAVSVQVKSCESG
jgi:hypothetical protein